MSAVDGPLPCWVNGALVDPTRPALRADDQGLTLGLGVFETLLCEEGCALHREEHLARLERGARAVGVPWPPPQDVDGAIDAVVAALDGATAALRLTYTRGSPGVGPTLIVAARAHVPPPPAGVVVAVSRLVMEPGDALAGIKSTERLRYVLAREEAVRAGAWEALLPTREGDLCEGSVSNLFAVVDGRVRTPSTDRGCLPGTTRDLVLAELRERPLAGPDGAPLEAVVDRVERADLARASELFLTNTTGRVIGILAVQGIVRGLPGSSGAVARELRRRVAEREEAYRRRKVPDTLRGSS